MVGNALEQKEALRLAKRFAEMVIQSLAQESNVMMGMRLMVMGAPLLAK